jgi:copper chaperone CopZ
MKKQNHKRPDEEAAMMRRVVFLCFMILLLMILPWFSTATAQENKDNPVQAKHQVTGLFMAEREGDLKETFAKIPQVSLVSIDFKNAEIAVEYVPGKAFPGAKPNQIVERLDNLVRTASNSTFGIKPLRTMPAEKLTRLEIPVEGLDCKACTLAAYEAVYKLEGVELAFASFRDGKVTAFVQPEKTDRAKLEDALKKKGVHVVKTP